MQTLSEIKAEHSKRLDVIIKECQVFWAFSNQQFAENKTPSEGNKYVSIGAGGYLPESKAKEFVDKTNELEKWLKESTNQSKKMRYDHIAYELANHEAFYTNDIEDTIQALGPGYSKKEVWKVFYKEREKQKN